MQGKYITINQSNTIDKLLLLYDLIICLRN